MPTRAELGFGDLEQQVDAAWRLGVVLTGDAVAATDAVAAAFVATARSLERGELGAGRFRLHLLAATRRLLAGPSGEPAGHLGPMTAGAAPVARFWRSPPQARAAVWLVDAERLNARGIGRVLDLEPENAVHLAERTRARLQASSLAARPTACPQAGSLPSYLAGRLGLRDAARMDRHVGVCGSCAAAVNAIEDLDNLAPAVTRTLPPVPGALARTALDRWHERLQAVGPVPAPLSPSSPSSPSVRPSNRTSPAPAADVSQPHRSHWALRPLAACCGALLAAGIVGAAAVRPQPSSQGGARPATPVSARLPTSLAPVPSQP